jgi:GT2 family glycosyltransferase
VGPFGRRDQDRLRAATSWPLVEFVTRPGEATGERLLFLDPAFEPQSPDWLAALLQVLRPGVGAAGGKQLRADGTVEHIGLVLGLDGVAGRPFLNAPADHPGYFGNAILIRTVSAVSGACLLTTRETFERVGGMDDSLGREAAAIDYCLKVNGAGERVVFTPWALLRRSAARAVPGPSATESEELRRRWKARVEHDPYYSPHLTRRALDYRVDA